MDQTELYNLLVKSRIELSDEPDPDGLYSIYLHLPDCPESDQLTDDDRAILTRHMEMGVEEVVNTLLKHKAS